MRIQKILFLAILLGLCFQTTLAQNKMNQLFWGTALVDNPTANTLSKNKLNISVMHRFGTVENGLKDVFGIYASSNIKMGLAYGLSDNLDLQYSYEKNFKTNQLAAKWKILSQTVDAQIPLTLAVFSAFNIKGVHEEFFGKNYRFSNRFSYESRLILARQIAYKFNIQSSLAFYHYNKTEQDLPNQFGSVDLSLAYKISPSFDLFFTYQYAQSFSKPKEELDLLPSFNLGVDISGHRHQYQVFITSSDNMNPVNSIPYNRNKISLKNLRIGFNLIIKI